MRTNTVIKCPPTVAIKAQQLIFTLREALTFEVVGNTISRPPQSVPVRCSPAINMVKGKKTRVSLATTSAFTPVRLNHFATGIIPFNLKVSENVFPVSIVPFFCYLASSFRMLCSVFTCSCVPFFWMIFAPFFTSRHLMFFVLEITNVCFLCQFFFCLLHTHNCNIKRNKYQVCSLVSDVSPEPRIDIFSREKREGFKQYGNESEKF